MQSRPTERRGMPILAVERKNSRKNKVVLSFLKQTLFWEDNWFGALKNMASINCLTVYTWEGDNGHLFSLVL